MSRNILNDLQMVDDIDEPDLDAIGDGKESGGSVPTITNKETGPKETSQTTTSAKTTGQSETVKMQRKRMAPRSKVWTEGHFIPIKDDNDIIIKGKCTYCGKELAADGVKRAMEDLFNEYKRKFSNQDNGKSSLSNMSSQCSIAMESQHTSRLAVLADKFKKQRIGGVFGDKSELDKYLSEDVEEADDTFDILGWWKVNSARFPILARIARDVLAIPISTVASESAFSTGGRILDAFRSSLSPNMVEALICAQDWIKMKNRINVEEDNDFADKLESAMSKLSLATNDVNIFGTPVLNSCT